MAESHKEYLLADPGYLNIAIRRKAFYKYYFDKFDLQHNLELVVIRPNKIAIEGFIQNELENAAQVYLLSHAGEFQIRIKHLELKASIHEVESKFYLHEVYKYSKD